MGRRTNKVKKTPAQMAEMWGKMYDEFFSEDKVTSRKEFIDEMMGVIDGNKFMADVTDIVLGQQTARSQAGIAAHRQENK